MPVKHLPPVIKQLLTLRSPQLPSPPLPSKLSAILSSTFKDAQRRKAENGWLTLTVRMHISAREDTAECNALRAADMHASDNKCPLFGRLSVQVCDKGRTRGQGVPPQLGRRDTEGGSDSGVCAEEQHFRRRTAGGRSLIHVPIVCEQIF